MPISRKTGAPYFTEEQLNYAKYETSTLEYVKQQGYPLKKKGAYYTHSDHSSLVFAPNGSWHWNSRSMHGNALDFITQVEHKPLIEAVLLLNGENALSQSNEQHVSQTAEAKPDYSIKESTEDKAEFVLPEKAKNYARMFAYLCKTRKIDNRVIQPLVNEDKLYLSSQLSANGKEINNVVFVSMDENGEARGAYSRGTWDTPNTKPFKMISAGTEKIFPFHMVGAHTNTVIAFEASIDALSHATMKLPEESSPGAIKPHRIALGGTWDGPLMHFLQYHPEITNITLAFDNDAGGKKATENAISDLLKAGYSADNITVISPISKDWNEDLINAVNEAERQSEDTEPDMT